MIKGSWKIENNPNIRISRPSSIWKSILTAEDSDFFFTKAGPVTIVIMLEKNIFFRRLAWLNLQFRPILKFLAQFLR